MSQLEVDKIVPQSGTTLTIGDSGDTINFADGQNINIDSNTLYIDSTNNRVGIGTTSPSSKLDVNGAVNIAATAWLTFGSNNTLFSSAAVAGLIIQSPTAGSENIIFRTSTGTERMRIDSSGNVGIGTSSPGAKLEVRGSAIFNEQGLDADFRVEGDTDANLLFVDASTDRVGIGTNAPGAKLEVRGSAIFNEQGLDADFRVEGDTDANLLFVDASTDRVGIGTNAPGAKLEVRGSVIFNEQGLDADFRVEGDTDASLFFVDASTDRVGIGTSSPSTKLTIDEGGEPPAEGMLILQANSSSRQLRIQPPTNADNGFIDFRGGNLTFLDDGTEVARFQGGGAMLLGTTTIGSAGAGDLSVNGGIFLGGTGTANKLDDYEEGTFTPAITVGSGSVTHSIQTGNYTKIGRLVYFDIRVALSAISSPSGSLLITGLPFTGGISGRSGLVKFTSVDNFSSITQPDIMSVYISTGTSIGLANNAGTGYNASNLAYNTLFDVSGMYQTN
jgi:hypothetical protein